MHDDNTYITRAEADRDHQRIHERLDQVMEAQAEIQARLREWEASAAIVRWVSVTTIALISMIMGILQWVRKS